MDVRAVSLCSALLVHSGGDGASKFSFGGLIIRFGFSGRRS